MSYDINLLDPVTKEVIEFDFPHQISGGNYVAGGTKYGMTGAESIPVLKEAISKLGDDTNPDYWKPTEGNAKEPLLGLLAFAQMRPDGIWYGD
jgi:hypothetical protein